MNIEKFLSLPIDNKKLLVLEFIKLFNYEVIMLVEDYPIFSSNLENDLHYYFSNKEEINITDTKIFFFSENETIKDQFNKYLKVCVFG